MARFTRAEIRRIIGETCTDEMENSIIALHIGVVDPLKDELEKSKGEVEKLANVQKELDSLKEKVKDAEDWKGKYEKEHSDFDQYKAKIDEEKTTNTKKSLYRELLKENKVDDKYLDRVMKITDFSDIAVKDGKLEGADKLSEAIKKEWAEYIPTTKAKGADVETPPNNGGAKMTKDQIFAIKDTQERQNAIAANIDLFS